MWGVEQPARLNGPQHPYRRTLRYAASRDMPAVLRIRFSSARQRTGCMATGTARSGRRTTRAQANASMIARVVFFLTACSRFSRPHAHSYGKRVARRKFVPCRHSDAAVDVERRWSLLYDQCAGGQFCGHMRAKYRNFRQNQHPRQRCDHIRGGRWSGKLSAHNQFCSRRRSRWQSVGAVPTLCVGHASSRRCVF